LSFYEFLFCGAGFLANQLISAWGFMYP